MTQLKNIVLLIIFACFANLKLHASDTLVHIKSSNFLYDVNKTYQTSDSIRIMAVCSSDVKMNFKYVWRIIVKNGPSMYDGGSVSPMFGDQYFDNSTIANDTVYVDLKFWWANFSGMNTGNNTLVIWPSNYPTNDTIKAPVKYEKIDLGLKNLSFSNSIVYTANSDLVIVPGGETINQISVFDMNGRVVKNINNQGKQDQTTIRNLKKGWYVLRISNNKSQRAVKFRIN